MTSGATILVPLRAFAPDVANLSPRAFRAYGRALALSCMNGTDGELTPADIETVGAKPADLKELLQSGVWQRDDQGRTFVRELRERPIGSDTDRSEVRHGETSGARRTREWRERQGSIPPSQRDAKQRHRDAESSVTVTQYVTEKSVTSDGAPVTPVSPAPPSDLHPDSDSSGFPDSSSVSGSDPKDLNGSARGAKRGPKRTPVPEPFPVESVLVYGRSKGLRDEEIRSECEGLVLWAKGDHALKADWISTAQGWLRRTALKLGRRPPASTDLDARRRQREKAAAEAAMQARARAELGGQVHEPEAAQQLLKQVIAGAKTGSGGVS